MKNLIKDGGRLQQQLGIILDIIFRRIGRNMDTVLTYINDKLTKINLTNKKRGNHAIWIW